MTCGVLIVNSVFFFVKYCVSVINSDECFDIALITKKNGDKICILIDFLSEIYSANKNNFNCMYVCKFSSVILGWYLYVNYHNSRI